MTLGALTSNPVVAEAIERRRRALVLLLLIDFGLIVALSTLSIRAPAPGTDADLFGFALAFEPLRWRTLIAIGAIVSVQLWVGARAIRAALGGDEVVSIYPKNDGESLELRGITTEEIVKMVLEVAKESGIRKISRIFLVPVPVPNAFTAKVLGMGNVVALHSNLFDFLNRDGVRAVIAHEVAHIKRGDSFVRQVTTAPGAFAGTIFSLTLLQIVAGVLDSAALGEFIWRVLFLALAVGATLLVFRLIARLAVTAAREAELIADAHACQICGKVTTANMLLLLGERTEALSTLLSTIGELMGREGEAARAITQAEVERLLAKFPPWELSQEVARRLAPRLFVQDRLEVLRDSYRVPLVQSEIDELVEKAAVTMASEAKEEEAKAEQEGNLAHWRSFDVDESGHLDAEELSVLVEALRKDPDRMIFRQFLSPESRSEDHPAVRDRILFLWDVAGEDL